MNQRAPGWRFRPQPWLVSYALVGLTQNGLAPILLPLASRGGAGSGLSYAAFAASGLLAPILGAWADSRGRHRDLLIWGSLFSAVFFGLFCLIPNGPVAIGLAAGAGAGVTAVTTAGNVLAVQGAVEVGVEGVQQAPQHRRRRGVGALTVGERDRDLG